MKQPPYIDIHAHLNFATFADDCADVVAAMEEAHTQALIVGTQYDTSTSACELARTYDAILGAVVGLHPIHTTAAYRDEAEVGTGGDTFTSRGEVFDVAAYTKLAERDEVVAIGECGLDYFRSNTENATTQQKAFVAQIALANKVGKPLMLHIRTSSPDSDDAYWDALELLDAHAEVPGNVHFFAGSTEVADAFLARGFTLSFTGVVTFADAYRELIAHVPLERMHAETDCPYVAPEPYRGTRNVPQYVSEVVRTIAAVKEMPEADVRAQLYANAQTLFRI